MKVIYLYGSDKDSLRRRLSAFKLQAYKKKMSVQEFDNSNFTEISSISEDLFELPRIFFLDSTKISSDDLNNLLEDRKDKEGIVVVYWFKTVSKTFLSGLPKADTEEAFELPFLAYRTIDKFLPGNFGAFYMLYQQVVKHNPVEMFFGILHKQIREMYLAAKCPENLNMPSWRADKLKKQANKWGEKNLKRLLEDLVEADKRTKTSPETLTDLLPQTLVPYMT